RVGKAVWIWSRIPAAPRDGSTSRRSRAATLPCPWPIPSCSLVPPISMPSTQGSAMRSPRSNPVVDGHLRGEAAVKVVDDPMEDDLVQGFRDSHIIDGRMEVVMGESLELTAGKAGDSQGGQAVFV